MTSGPSLSLLLAMAAGGVLGWLGHARQQQRRQGPRRRALAGTAPVALPAEQWRRWIEDAPQGWLVIAPDHSIASINAKAEKLLGVDAEGRRRAAWDRALAKKSTAELRQLLGEIETTMRTGRATDAVTALWREARDN
jgi:PAS domain-containing protein